MMSEKEHTELIDYIKESLKRHEESYEPGAWETFQQYRKEKQRAIVGKTALGIAASLILLFSLLFLLNDVKNTVPEEPTTGYLKERKPANPDKQGDILPDISPEPQNMATDRQREMSDKEPKSDNVDTVFTTNDVSGAASSDNIPDIAPKAMQQKKLSLLSPVTISAQSDLQKIAEPPRMNAEPLTYQQSYWERTAKGLSFGLAYAPLINANATKMDWSMGGGLYTEWNIARNLALSSGIFIAQNRLKYDKSGSMEGVDTENITHLQVDLVSMEVPLTLRYFLTENISVSAGISSIAFLKEHYNYIYEYQREVQEWEYREGVGYELITREITVTESDKQSEPPFDAVDGSAFYTFSLSYQYDISGRHTLSLEPFVKLPSGRLTSRDIRYYTGGLQMRISF